MPNLFNTGQHIKPTLHLLIALAGISTVFAQAPGGIFQKFDRYGDGKAITSGHWDFKPSWSINGDHLVFFRRLMNDPVVSNWITQLCIINADGTGFHPLSEGTFTYFNPSWTRDGTNTAVWQVSTDPKADYRYPHGEATPN